MSFVFPNKAIQNMQVNLFEIIQIPGIIVSLAIYLLKDYLKAICDVETLYKSNIYIQACRYYELTLDTINITDI